MTPIDLMLVSFRSAATRAAAVAAVACGLLSVPGDAGAVSMRVKLACANDYYSHCSQHPIGSPAVRQCMRDHGPQLSKGCIKALVTAGEVSEDEVASRRAAVNAAAN